MYPETGNLYDVLYTKNVRRQRVLIPSFYFTLTTRDNERFRVVTSVLFFFPLFVYLFLYPILESFDIRSIPVFETDKTNCGIRTVMDSFGEGP